MTLEELLNIYMYNVIINNKVHVLMVVNLLNAKVFREAKLMMSIFLKYSIHVFYYEYVYQAPCTCKYLRDTHRVNFAYLFILRLHDPVTAAETIP